MKHEEAIERAIRSEDWESVALLTLLRFLETAHLMPDATIDDLIDALTEAEATDERDR